MPGASGSASPVAAPGSARASDPCVTAEAFATGVKERISQGRLDAAKRRLEKTPEGCAKVAATLVELRASVESALASDLGADELVLAGRRAREAGDLVPQRRGYDRLRA